jgi:hypothetical protein
MRIGERFRFSLVTVESRNRQERIRTGKVPKDAAHQCRGEETERKEIKTKQSVSDLTEKKRCSKVKSCAPRTRSYFFVGWAAKDALRQCIKNKRHINN